MPGMTYAEAVPYCKSRGYSPAANNDKFVTCVSAVQRNRGNTAYAVNIRGNPVSRKNRKSRRNRKNRKSTRRNRRN